MIQGPDVLDGIARSADSVDMRRSLAVVLSWTLAWAAVLPVPVLSAAAGAAQATASLSGTARTNSGTALGNETVQLRNIATGQLTATTTSSASGAFSFTALPAGQYTVEVVNAAGQIVGTSAAVTVAAGAAVTGVGVTGTTVAAAAAGLSTTAIIGITAAAVAGGIVTVVAINHNSNASPSQ